MNRSAVQHAPLLRGSPSRESEFKEQLQDGYLHAVCAAAGCGMSYTKLDEGVDWSLTHRSPQHSASTDGVARLEMQLKATTKPINDGFISASMSRARYDYYRVIDPSVHKIIVVMSVPSNPAHWIFARHKGLMLHRCAYWVNLAGMPEIATSAESITIKAPLENVFNDVSLCRIMERIGEGGKP